MSWRFNMRIPSAFMCSAAMRKVEDEPRIGAVVGVSRTSAKRKKKQKRVLQSKGASVPKQPSPMEETRAQIELEQARARMAAEQAAKDKAAADAAQAAKIEKARGIQANAYNDAINYGNEQVTGRGLNQGLVDKYNVLGLYGSDINRQKSGIAEDALNPLYNSNTSFADALSTATGAYRADTRNNFNSTYGDNYSYGQFADTADDNILQAILDSRRADALATIDAAKARGQLNDVGYGRSMSKLDEQAKSGMADLQKIGGGVLSGYRSDIDSSLANELTKIGSLDLTQLYDPSGFGTRIGDSISNKNNSLEGDIYKAIGNSSFFDPSTIISGSGAVQGYYNPTTTKNTTTANNPLLSAFTDDATKKNSGTSVGNTGVF